MKMNLIKSLLNKTLLFYFLLSVSSISISEEEKIEFIETLTSAEFEIITLFFASMPVVQNVIEFECGNCGTENEVVMNGFFGESE